MPMIMHDSRQIQTSQLPFLGSLARAQWLEDRRAEILDTQYFHVVFTIPKEIAEIAFQNKQTGAPEKPAGSRW